MILLGVDYGTKRVGLATGDSGSGLAFPLRSAEGGSRGEAVEAVRAAAAEEKAERVVVGMPRTLSGEAGPMADEVAEFVTALRGRGLEIETEDERMTTALVERRRREGGGKGDKDAMAAAAILETYMERTRELENRSTGEPR